MGVEASKTNLPMELRIKTLTYTRDSYGLFDFDGSDHKINEFDLTRSAIITRQDHSTKITEKPCFKKNLYNLVHVDFCDDTVILNKMDHQFASLDGYDEKKLREGNDFYEHFVWMNIRNYAKGYPLEEGDVFRLGRLRFRVREVFLGKNKVGIAYDEGRIKQGLNTKAICKDVTCQKEMNLEESAALLCRICLEPEGVGSRFADVCSCTKTMPLHAECLMQWIRNKVNKKSSPHFEFYSWKFQDCDICRTPFPECFTCNGTRFDLLVMDRPEIPFIAIDQFNKEMNTIRGCFVVNSRSKATYKIGRGTDCEIRLSDISVSRTHASQIYNKGYFQLNDLKSKFGTLLLVDEPIDLKMQKRQSNFQVGKTVVEFLFKNTAIPTKCCGRKSGITYNSVPLNPFEELENDPVDLRENNTLEENYGYEEEFGKVKNTEDHIGFDKGGRMKLFGILGNEKQISSEPNINSLKWMNPLEENDLMHNINRNGIPVHNNQNFVPPPLQNNQNDLENNHNSSNVSDFFYDIDDNNENNDEQPNSLQVEVEEGDDGEDYEFESNDDEVQDFFK